MNISHLLYGIMDTAIYSLVGMLMMGIGILIVIVVTPFSVKKEIEDDQNMSLGIIMGAVILGIAIIIGNVISAPATGSAVFKPATVQKADTAPKADTAE